MGIKLIDAEKRKYRVAFWYRRRHYAKVVTGNRKLAQDIEMQMRAQLAESRYFPERNRPNLPFSEAAQRFLDEYAKLKPSSKHYYYNTVSAIKFFGSKPVHDITPEDIRHYRARQKAAGMHPVTVNHRQKNLRRMFNWLEEVGLFFGQNPASGKRVKLENERPYWRKDYLTKEQFQSLLAMAAPSLRTIIICAVHTGMRQGELRRIEKKDVNLDECILLIPRSKNGEPSSVPITDTLYSVLAPIIRTLPHPHSKVLDFTNFDRLWDAARRSAGLLREEWQEGQTRWQKVKSNKNFHFHDLRHTAASWAIMGSKNPYAIQAFLRLKTPGLMMRYAHLSQSYVRSAALSLDKELPFVPQPPSVCTTLVTPVSEGPQPIRIPNDQPLANTAKS